MSWYCGISPTSSAPWVRRRATTWSMSSTAHMMRGMPSVFAGAPSGSALTAGGVWNFVSSTRLWPSGVRIMAMSARTSLSPTTRSTQRPSTVVSPSSSIPSSAKNALAASRSSTTMSTLSIRSNLLFAVIHYPVGKDESALPLLGRPAIRLGARTAHQHRPFTGAQAVGLTEGLDGLLVVDDRKGASPVGAPQAAFETPGIEHAGERVPDVRERIWRPGQRAGAADLDRPVRAPREV